MPLFAAFSRPGLDLAAPRLRNSRLIWGLPVRLPAFGHLVSGVPLLSWVVLAYLLPVLLTLGWVTPPWQNPDEPLHMARAVQLAHGGLFGARQWGTAGGISDPAIYAAYMPVRHAAMHPEEPLSRADLTASQAVRFSPAASFVSFPNTAQYPPFFYVPGALSYWAGWAAGLSVDATLRLIRAANAVMFAAAAAAALAIGRRARPLLAALILLPGTLQLACSASQDAGTLAATLLAVALIDRMIAERRGATSGEAACIAILLTTSAMARPPYACMLLLLFLLAPRLGRREFGLTLALSVLVIAWCLLTAIFVSVRFSHADPAAQIAFVSKHAAELPAILLATARFYAGEYWRQFIGELGWNDTFLPGSYIALASAVLTLSTAASASGPARRPALAAAALLGAVIAIFVLQYLTWTWPGQLVITGVLGRYFTPLAMVLALALPAWRPASHLVAPAWLAILLLAALTPAVMLHTLLVRYYIF